MILPRAALLEDQTVLIAALAAGDLVGHAGLADVDAIALLGVRGRQARHDQRPG
jgi:hypothetical protein